jgi:nicotinamide-nucleotide amidase
MQNDELVGNLAQLLTERGWSLACAESCTAGGLSFALTALPGSSQWFDGGYVTYSEQSKIDCLGVSKQLLNTHGAVSKDCALAMARGALEPMQADIALAITGIAGPAGGTAQLPVGTVWVAVAGRAFSEQVVLWQLNGSRQTIRQQCIRRALVWLHQQLSAHLRAS